MTLTINGQIQELPNSVSSLADLLQHLGLGGKPVVVERNHQAVPPSTHATVVLNEGDVLEIVTISAGG